MHHKGQMSLVMQVASFLLLLGSASANIMAIDLGSEYLKVSLVKPGRIPISIVHNEMSKRKTTAAVALVNGDRLVGEEAAALAVRYPDRVFTRLRDLLGRSHDDPAVVRLLQQSRLPFQVVPAPNRTDGAAGVVTDTGDVYSIEELVASLFEYAKSLAQAAADGVPVSDCVLVVPAFFDQAQRRALLDAASLAGLNVMALVHAHAAAALQYGIERDFTNKTEDVLFYDLGAASAQAALVRFSAFPGPSSSGPAISQFEVRDVAWVEHGVGGDALEAALLEHFAGEHSAGAEAVLSAPRAVAKLRRQVRRTKEMLSANSEAPVSVEDLLPGVDFRSKVGRDGFEGLAGAAWTRAAAPITELLRRNNLTAGDLAAVELLGGTSRVPRVKAVLSEALGGRGLDMHLDADEAVVLGAGLVAANLSTTFRLRKFGMTDKTPFAVTFQLEGAEEAEGGSGEEARVLVPPMRKMPTRRAIALSNLTAESFKVALGVDNAFGAALPCCRRRDTLGWFEVSGIAGVVAKYSHSGKVALHTRVDASGVFWVDRADAAVEIEEEIKPEPAPAANAALNATAVDANGTANGTATIPEEPLAAGDGINGTTEAGGGGSLEQPEHAGGVNSRKRTIRVPLNVTGGLARPGMSKEQLTAARRALRTLRERDNAKRATAKARNDLEAYIISTRDKLDPPSKELKAVTTEAQREALLAASAAAEDWLYGDGDAVGAAEYRAKLDELQRDGDAMERRVSEAVDRPAAVKGALEFVKLARSTAKAWAKSKPWIEASERGEAVAKVDEFEAWVKGQVAEQAKRAAHEEPAVEANDVLSRLQAASKTFLRLDKKLKPAPPPPPPPKNATAEAAGNDTASAEAAGAKDDDAAAAGALAAEGMDAAAESVASGAAAEGEASARDEL